MTSHDYQRMSNDLLSRLVATRVMGWTTEGEHHSDPDAWDGWRAPHGACGYPEPPGFASHMIPAMLVVNELRRRTDGHFTLMAFTSCWRAGWATPNEDDCGVVARLTQPGFARFADAPTPERAICIAALRLSDSGALRLATSVDFCTWEGCDQPPTYCVGHAEEYADHRPKPAEGTR